MCLYTACFNIWEEPKARLFPKIPKLVLFEIFLVPSFSQNRFGNYNNDRHAYYIIFFTAKYKINIRTLMK
jgi:hypothetical protein